MLSGRARREQRQQRQTTGQADHGVCISSACAGATGWRCHRCTSTLASLVLHTAGTKYTHTQVSVSTLPLPCPPDTTTAAKITAASVRKWYHGRRDPIEVLEADPDLVLRAQVRLRVCRRRRVCVVPCTQSGMVRGGEGW
jgi:hypothetical protein